MVLRPASKTLLLSIACTDEPKRVSARSKLRASFQALSGVLNDGAGFLAQIRACRWTNCLPQTNCLLSPARESYRRGHPFWRRDHRTVIPDLKQRKRGGKARVLLIPLGMSAGRRVAH